MLYIVATPIGNLKDITLRALEVLKSSDLILCEDTRNTLKLLNHYGIKKELMSFHQHTDERKLNEILAILNDKEVALVTDSGTPGISDPGGKLVEKAIEKNIKVIPVPGPSALAAAISASGIAFDKFVFMGFPPVKNKRNKYFEEINSFNYPVVFYESSHKILKTLEDLEKICNDPQVIIFREMTKIYESSYRGKVSEVKNLIETKGEFVIIKLYDKQ